MQDWFDESDNPHASSSVHVNESSLSLCKDSSDDSKSDSASNSLESSQSSNSDGNDNSNNQNKSLIFVTDLDHTLIGRNRNNTQETAYDCKQYLKQFNQIWLNYYSNNSNDNNNDNNNSNECNNILIYATGRSFNGFEYAKHGQHWPLMTPDILICHDGIEIYIFNKKLNKCVNKLIDATNTPNRKYLNK